MTFKQKFFETMDVMYQSQIVTPTFYFILCLLEFLQMLYYSTIQTHLFKTDYFRFFREAISYFQVVAFLPSVDESIFGAFIIFSLIYLLASVGLLIWVLFAPKTTITIYATRVYNLFMILLITVFFMPFLSSFLASFNCLARIDCEAAFYFAMLSLSIIGIILIFILTIFFEIFLVDYNPFNPIIYASKYTKLNWAELVFKIFLPIFAVFDSNSDAEIAFISLLCIMYLFMITLRLKTQQFVDRRVNLVKLCQTSLLFWWTLVSVIHTFLDEGSVDDIGFFYEVLCSPIVVYCCVKLNRNPELNPHIRKELELEETIQVMIHLIESRDKPINRMQLEGFVKLHLRDCFKTVDQCPCTILHQDNLRGEDQNRGQQWYSFLQALIQNSSDRLLTTRVQIIRSYILQKKLKNKFKAFYELSIAQKKRVSFQEEFCIYRLQNQIEQEMVENDKNEDIDVQQIVNFQNFYIAFEQAIEKSVNLHLEYWRELQEDNPDVGKLMQLGTQITSIIDEAEHLYEKLLKINGSHLKTLDIFGNFLMHVVNNDIEAQRIMDRAEQIARNLELNRIIDSEKFKYDQNSDTCIISCSLNVANLGSITNCNNEITKLLGYKKQELLKSNISRVMPKVLAQVHDDYIRNFVQTSQSKVLGIERQVFAVNKKGFLVPCSLMIRVLPNLKNGLQIVGFLKKSESTDQYCYIMYDDLAHSVIGFSESVHEKFGLPLSIAQGVTELHLEEIAVNLATLANDNKTGIFDFVIDTTVLENNYQIVQEPSLDEIPQEDQSKFYGNLGDNDYIEQHNLLDAARGLQVASVTKRDQMLKFRKASLKGMVFEDHEYGNTKIKTIQFIEDVPEAQYKTQVERKKEDNVEAQDAIENVVASEVSSGISVNDEIRQIKEFKVMMGERSESRNISRLNKTIIFLIVVLIILASLQLGYRIQQNELLYQGNDAIKTSFYRNSVMADVIFYARYLELMARKITTYDVSAREKLSTQVDILKEIQYSIIKYRIEMESRDGRTEDQKVTVQYQLTTGVENRQLKLMDAIFQLISSASTIRNASLNSFIQSNSSENTQKDLHFVITNGYTVLREGSEEIANQYLDYYTSALQDYETIFVIILTFSVLVLVASLLLLVPIVLKIHNINNKVISLFGLLSPKEIKELAEQCDEFKAKYLNQQYTHKSDDKTKVLKNSFDVSKLQPNTLPDPNANDKSLIMEINNEAPQSAINVSAKPLRPEKEKQQPQTNPQQPLGEDNLMDQENLRQQKLLKSKSSNTITIAIKFLIMMGVFMVYFILNLVLEQNLVKESKELYKHLSFTMKRPAQIKYSVYYTVEQILQQPNQKEKMIQQLYENERMTLQSLQFGFPTTYSSYLSYYYQFNLQSLCLQQFSTKSFTLDQAACVKISNGILDKGLRNAITSLALWATNVKNESLATLDTPLFKSYIEQIYYIDQSVIFLSSLNSESASNFVEQEQEVEKIKFVIFILTLALALLLIWVPYVRGLSRQIWRTKGMLNMIPLEMIKSQETLKHAFLKGNIITAVR